ncbi:MAG: DNA polymerase III subunit beta [Patescibacteria group bacterium]
MKFTCTKDNLVHALQFVGGAAGKNINLPILNNVLISTEERTVRFITTNLEMAIKTNVRGVVEQEGKFTVPAKTLSEYIQLVSSDQVTLSLEDNEIVIQTGKSKTKIKGNPADEFPILPTVDVRARYVVNARELRTALSRVLFACSRSETRPELSGVFMQFNKTPNTLTLAATDSYRLSEAQIPLLGAQEGAVQAIIPQRTLSEVLRITVGHPDDTLINVIFDETQVVFEIGEVTLSTRKIDGRYPDYAQIIPTQYKTRAYFSTEALAKEVKAASIFASQGVNAVIMECKPAESSLSISSTSTQLGEHASSLTVEATGEDGGALLNYRYVLDGISALQATEGEIWFLSTTSPVVFKPKDSQGFLYIIMPIRQ